MAITTSICNVRLIPLDFIRQYSNIDGEISVTARQDKIEAMNIVPGSATVSDEDAGDGSYTKRHAFKIRSTFKKERYYKKLDTMKVIMLYSDEVGEERVSGSVTHPLSVKITRQGGLLLFTLTGKDVSSDGILI